MWKFTTYLEYGKVLESTVNKSPIELNRVKIEYYFLTNIEPNLKYYLDK